MAHRRVERREHTRIGEHASAGQPVEERRFSSVGIADHCDRGERHGLPLAPLYRTMRANRRQILLDFLDAPGNATAIGLELRFTGSARSDAASEPGHGGSMSGQPWEKVVELSELHLKLAFARACAA